MNPSVDLPPLPFLPSAEERIKMVRWGTEIARAERARIADILTRRGLAAGGVSPDVREALSEATAEILR